MIGHSQNARKYTEKSGYWVAYNKKNDQIQPKQFALCLFIH